MLLRTWLDQFNQALTKFQSKHIANLGLFMMLKKIYQSRPTLGGWGSCQVNVFTRLRSSLSSQSSQLLGLILPYCSSKTSLEVF